jgi:DNA mismatch repair protein MutS2
MRVYEAENALIKQIDTALISGLTEFAVIHGLGEGILQKSVHDFLGNCASVSNFSFSSPEEGGYGKTIVQLKNGI